MRKLRLSLAALLVLMVFVAALSGCGCFNKSLVSINGEKITRDQFYSTVERATAQRLVRLGGNQPVSAGLVIMRKMISDELLLQYAKEQGVTPTEQQVERRTKVDRKMQGSELEQNLRAQGSNPVDYKIDLNVGQANINLMGKGIKIPEEDVRKTYEKIMQSGASSYRRPAQIFLSVILVERKESADKAHELLRADTDFETVALRLNELANLRQTGGKVGWISANDPTLPKEIREHLAVMGVNEYSKPFSYPSKKDRSLTWAIVKVDRKRKELRLPYSDVKQIIREDLAAEQGYRKSFRKIISGFQGFIKRADITVNSTVEGYNQIPEQMKKQAKGVLEQIKKQPPPGAPNAPPKP